jgi:glutamate racemase
MIDHPPPRTQIEAVAPPRIGVFDSGVGGVSILRALRQRLPGTSMTYIGDTAFAPYGERSASDVSQRSEHIVHRLLQEGAELIVVACNTATVLAIDGLRRRWPAMRFVGVEPGVKPGLARSRTGRIAVMATPATASSQRLATLIRRHAEGERVHVYPCPGLAEAIERGVVAGPALTTILAPVCQAIAEAGADTVVLGCTHYPFVADALRQLLGPGVELVDTADAIAARAASLWTCPPETASSVRVWSTGRSQTLTLLLRRCPGLESAPVRLLV